MNPILLDFPDYFETERLFIRARKPGDGKEINTAIVETFEDLRLWMPWADHIPPLEETEEYARRAAADFITRKVLDFSIFLKDSNQFVGSIGLPRLDWRIPKFEIGYWIRKSQQSNGYAFEAAEGMTKFTFETLNAKRVEIRCDPNNVKSTRIAHKLCFDLEGVLRNDYISPSGHVRDTVVYAKIRD